MTATLIWLGGGLASAQQRVGVYGGVNQQATGTPPGQNARRLVIGQEVVYNERVATSDVGQTQIAFLDESSLSIGPSSDLTIDQFVYDPRSGTGKLAMTTTRGVLRFVGGKLSKQDNAVTLSTTAAVLAVRGGAFILNQQPNGSMEAIFLYGRGLTITGRAGVSQTLERPGFGVTVAGPGAPPSVPAPVPPGRLALLVNQVDGRPGANGGAAQIPTDATVVNSGVGGTVSGNLYASLQAAAQARPQTPTPYPPDPSTLQTNLQIQNVQAQQSVVVQGAQASGVVIPYTDRQFLLTNQGTSTSIPAISYQLQDGTMSVVVNGGSGSFPLAPGNANFGPQGTTSTAGPLTGSSFLSPDKAVFYAAATSPNYPGAAGLLFGGLPSVTIPTAGIGSYSGTAAGSAFNNGSTRLASGTFTNTYNFGTNSGNFAVNNFDGRNFAGPVQGASGSYSGALAGNNLSGNVNGRFYGPVAADTGGSFAVRSTVGSPYSATAVFGGVR